MDERNEAVGVGLITNRAVVAVVLALAPAIVFGQSTPNTPIRTTLCELVKAPAEFSGKIVQVRGRVLIAFESFEISALECADKTIDAVWLEYGRGPKRQPTIWCCGDLTPRDSLALNQNAEFRKFDRYLTERAKSGGHVTATFTGRFDAVKTEPCPGNRQMHCCMLVGGFGHMGMACARLVIQSVSDVKSVH